jgi:class 3 adenylate cyclase
MTVTFDPLGERALLEELLHRYNEQPEQRARIAAEIERRFRRPLAILALDSCGFSRRVLSQGIIHYLALLERLKRLILPLIRRRGGRFLREDADNFFAVFPDAASAVACADEICRHVDTVNEALPSAEEVYVSIGVGYGDALVVGPDDIYGAEMNLTCKLGEDLAQQGEVLVTEAAHRALGPTATWQFEPRHFTISGLDLTAYQLVRERPRPELEPTPEVPAGRAEPILALPTPRR